MIGIDHIKKALVERGIVTARADQRGADYPGAIYLMVVPIPPDPSQPDEVTSGPVRSVTYLYHELYGALPENIRQAPDSLVLMKSSDATLAICVPWGATVAANPRDDRLLEIADYNLPGENFLWNPDAPEEPPPWAAPVVAAARALPGVRGAKILFKADLRGYDATADYPALECAAELALRDMNGLGDAPDDWPAGRARVATSTVAEAGNAVLVRNGRAELVPWNLDEAGMRLLLALDLENGEEPAAEQLVEDHVVEEAVELMKNLDFEGFGRFMSLPCPWAETALRAGALGIRPIEKGGSFIALASSRAVKEIRAAVNAESRALDIAPPKFLSLSPILGARELAARAAPPPVSTQ